MSDESTIIDLDGKRVEVESKEVFWSHTRPDEPGLYMFKPNGRNEVHLFEVTGALRVKSTLDGFDGASVVDLSGEWLYGLGQHYDT